MAKPGRKPNFERRARILKLYEAGMSTREIAVVILPRVSPQAIWQQVRYARNDAKAIANAKR